MSRKEHHGAKGAIKLRRDWEESASSHYERQDDYELVASDETTLVLTHTYGSSNSFRMGEGRIETERFSVPVADLIRFIETHGKRVP